MVNMVLSQLALVAPPLKSFLESAVSRFHQGSKALVTAAKADPMVRGALLVLGGELLGGVGQEVAVVVSATVMGDAMGAKARGDDTEAGTATEDGPGDEVDPDDLGLEKEEAPDAVPGQGTERASSLVPGPDAVPGEE